MDGRGPAHPSFGMTQTFSKMMASMIIFCKRMSYTKTRHSGAPPTDHAFGMTMTLTSRWILARQCSYGESIWHCVEFTSIKVIFDVSIEHALLQT